jgi:hypothetical protein
MIDRRSATRGRPALDRERRPSVRVHIRVAPDVRESMRVAAKAAGVTVSRLLRDGFVYAQKSPAIE